MKLEEIGFYTLSDERARTASITSPLQRVEMILTNKCNFKCPYCRGLRKDIDREMSFDEAMLNIERFAAADIQNIRFSGGEPTIWPRLEELISFAKKNGIKRIALSTNGSADYGLYEKLISAGVDDFSISFDACCAATADSMAGVSGQWKTVVSNIGKIARKVYTTVGVVITEKNFKEVSVIAEFAHGLHAHDIRIIPAAQFGTQLQDMVIRKPLLDAHPILKYRYDRMKVNEPVRGLCQEDSHKCRLVLDDIAVAGSYHFPCIIYLREQGNPINNIYTTAEKIRKERLDWMNNHDTHKDKICSRNCLDVCVAYNNACEKLRKVAS